MAQPAQATFADEESQEATVKIQDPNDNSTPSMKKNNSKTKRANTNVGIINKFILQFNRVEKAYIEVEDAYISVAHLQGSKSHRRSKTVQDRMKRTCNMEWISPILKHLGFGDPLCFSDEELEKIFDKKVSSKEAISFQRLLIGVGLSYFAKMEKDEQQEQEDSNTEIEHNGDDAKDPMDDVDDEDADKPRTEESVRFETLSAGFEVVKKMFDAIDVDGSGEISVQEFADSFNDICRDPDIVKARMDELDYNHDNDISFREFIFGISAWVGFNDEMSTDDADQDLDAQSPPTEDK